MNRPIFISALVFLSCSLLACDKQVENNTARNSLPPITTGLNFTNADPITVSEVEELHEDADGKVWLPVYQPPHLIRIDFSQTGPQSDTLGQAGNAPGEFQMPFVVMNTQGGGIAALDGVSRRLVGFSAAGTPDSVWSVPEQLDQFHVRRDSMNNWVSLLVENVRNDSASLIKLSGNSSDTLGGLHIPAATVSIPMGARSYVAPPEYSPRDLWGLLSNGTVWIARGKNLQVDYILPDGSRTIAGPRSFIPVRSNEHDKGELRGLPAPSEIPVQALQYAEVKGPFIEARAGQDGSVWVWRTQPAPRTHELYTVFKPGEVQTLDVELPLHHRLLGIGSNSVYVGERLSNGTWRITRHPRPDL